jgi:hypothetical protein
MSCLRMGCALFFVACLVATSQGDVFWTDWTSASFGAPGSADGTLTLPSGVVDINYTGEVASPTQVAGGINYWSPATPYLSATVPNEPPAADIITLSGGQGIHSVLTFSKPLTNPLMAIVSLGTPAFAVDYDFDTPFTVLSSGPGYWGGPGTLTDIGGNVLEGVEGHGVIQFQGTIETLSWTIPANEFWHGFTIGEASEPSSALLLVFGAIPLAWCLNARRIRK